MQALLFATLLAFARAHQDERPRSSRPSPACSRALLIFIRDRRAAGVIGALAGGRRALLARGPAAAARRLSRDVRRRSALLGGCYLDGADARATSSTPQIYRSQLSRGHDVAASVRLARGCSCSPRRWLRAPLRDRARLVAAVAIAAVRRRGGRLRVVLPAACRRKLTDYDALALRTFTDVLSSAARRSSRAVLGAHRLSRDAFWREPALVLIVFARVLRCSSSTRSASCPSTSGRRAGSCR